MGTAQQRLIRSIPEPLIANRTIVFFESVLTILFVWSVLTYGLGLEHRISSPTLVFATLLELLEAGEWWEHLADTLRRTLYGFALTIVVGTAIGIVAGMSDFWEKALQDHVTIGLAFPSLFAAVFAAMWFGFSDITPTVAAAVIAFPFLTQEVYEGVKDIDGELLEMSSAFEVSRYSVIRNVVVPSILPQWFGGARYSFAISWKIVTLAELVAANSGIGFMIDQAMQRLALSEVIAWTVLFMVVLLVFEYGVLRQVEKRMLDWQQKRTIGW